MLKIKREDIIRAIRIVAKTLGTDDPDEGHSHASTRWANDTYVPQSGCTVLHQDPLRRG